MKSKQTADILIVGAGPIGLCMALVLAQSHFKVIVVDQSDPRSFLKPTYDGRTTAIAYGSVPFFEHIGIWSSLLPGAEPIHEIYVSAENQRGYIHYRSQDIGEHPFGYIVENQRLRQALFSHLVAGKNATVYAPCLLDQLTFKEINVIATLSMGSVIQASLCLAADGKKSALRQQAGISVTELPYNQTALAFGVRHSKPHLGRAFEHFLSTGPLAFLPMSGSKSSVVWSLNNNLAKIMQDLSERDFSGELQERFGETLGDLSLDGKIWSYPLSALIPHSYVGRRLALIGDAAHTIHPVAGQGFNLGLRDVTTLALLLKEAQKLGLDIGSASLLERYQRQRCVDTHTMTGITDGLVRLFSNKGRALSRLSSFGLSLTNQMPLLKRLLTRHAMGLSLRTGANSTISPK